MILSIKQTIMPTKTQKIIFDCMSYSAAKLWNIGNYEKLNYKELGFDVFPSWYDQKKRLKNEFWYKNLPSQTAQEVLNTLHQAWKSFFKLRETGGVINARPPRFKRHTNSFSYLNNGFLKGDDGHIRLSISKQLRVYLKNHHHIDDNFIFLKTKRFLNIDGIKQVQIRPLKNKKFEIIVLYEVADAMVRPDNGHYLSIDPGLKNLLTCYDNCGTSFIMSSGPYLNANYYYNKKIAHYQSISDSQQKTAYPKKSKRVLALYAKKNNVIQDTLHKTTHYIVSYCVKHHINRVVIGDISGIRVDKNLGHKTNQVFHSLPFDRIKQMLTYKLARFGILLINQKEYYTSQCGPHTPHVSKEYGRKQNRKKRGLYVDGTNVYNADSLGAYNILRLYGQTNGLNLVCPAKGLSNPVKVTV